MMGKRQRQPATHLIASSDQPLIAVPIEGAGRQGVAYFVDEAEADHALRDGTARPAIKLAGVWADLDAEEMLAELDRLRHASTPTPPITAL